MYLLTVVAFYASTFMKVGYMSTTTETFDSMEQCQAAETIVVQQIKDSTTRLDTLSSSCKFVGK